MGPCTLTPCTEARTLLLLLSGSKLMLVMQRPVLDFGKLEVGATKTLYLELENGTAAVQVQSRDSMQASAADELHCCPGMLQCRICLARCIVVSHSQCMHSYTPLYKHS